MFVFERVSQEKAVTLCQSARHVVTERGGRCQSGCFIVLVAVEELAAQHAIVIHLLHGDLFHLHPASYVSVTHTCVCTSKHTHTKQKAILNGDSFVLLSMIFHSLKKKIA